MANIIVSASIAVSAVIKRKDFCYTSSEESSDSDDVILIHRHQKRKRQRIRNYIEIVHLYDGKDFQSHFRLTRSCVEVMFFNVHIYVYLSFLY